MTDLEKTESTTGNITRFVSLMILVLFLCSGMTGLLYQVIWSRMIVKVVWSQTNSVHLI